MSAKIKFIAIENHAHSSAKTGACVASVEHNGTWTKEILAQEVAKRCGMHSNQAHAFMDALDDVVCEGIASGNKVKFESFSIGISMKGSLKAANSKFDPARNALGVFFAPTQKLTKALASLEPENATKMDRPWLNEVCCEGVQEPNCIRIGSRVSVNGMNIRIDASQADEGAWLENLSGEKLLKAEIIRSDSASLVGVFNGSLELGAYRLAVYTRDGGASNGVVGDARRRVKLVG